MTPRIARSHDIHIDSDYIEWITELKQRYRSAQVKAVIKVNAEKLQFNWLLGRDLVRKKAEERWGSGVVEQLSLDLRRDFPDADGFSVSNLWFMKKWYCFYTRKGANQILYQAGRELAKSKSSRSDSEKLQQPVRELDKTKLHQVGAVLPAIFTGIPWRHHVEIITKCKSVEEALFYIKKTVEQGMSRAALINCIKADLYSHQGKIVNNFTEKLPDLQSKLVQDVLKENYDFGFATVGHEIYDEAELEEALTKNNSHPPNPSSTLYSRVYSVLASDSERFTQLAMDLGTLAALRLSASPSSVRLTERQRSSLCSRVRWM